MARARLYFVLQETDGDVRPNVAVTVLATDGVTPFAQTMYDAVSGGNVVTSPTTNSSGVLTLFAASPSRCILSIAGTLYPGDFEGDWSQVAMLDGSGGALTGQLLLADGSGTMPGPSLVPALAFGSDPDTGVQRVAANTLGITTGGEQAMEFRKGIRWQQFVIGNLGYLHTAGDGVLGHIHHRITASDGGTLVGLTIELQQDSTTDDGNPPDSSGVSSIIRQTAAAADGAVRAFEGHAYRADAAAGATATSTLMGMELSIASKAAGNASFPGTPGAFPKNILLFGGVYASDVVASGGVRADVAYLMWGDLGVKSLLHWIDTDGSTVLMDVNQNGLIRMGTGGNAGAPTYSWQLDSDTGMYRIGANSMGLATAGLNAMIVDSSQRVGVNVTPVSPFHVQGIQTLRSGAAGTAAELQMGRTATEGTLAIASSIGGFASAAAVGDTVFRAESTAKVHLGSAGWTSVTAGNSGGTEATLSFYGVTAVVRPSALTQTYATASATHANPTAAALTDNSGGAASGTLAAITGGGAGCENATKNAIASLAAQVALLIADDANTKQFLNSTVDKLQALGLLQ